MTEGNEDTPAVAVVAEEMINGDDVGKGTAEEEPSAAAIEDFPTEEETTVEEASAEEETATEEETLTEEEAPSPDENPAEEEAVGEDEPEAPVEDAVDEEAAAEEPVEEQAPSEEESPADEEAAEEEAPLEEETPVEEDATEEEEEEGLSIDEEVPVNEEPPVEEDAVEEEETPVEEDAVEEEVPSEEEPGTPVEDEVATEEAPLKIPVEKQVKPKVRVVSPERTRPTPDSRSKSVPKSRGVNAQSDFNSQRPRSAPSRGDRAPSCFTRLYNLSLPMQEQGKKRREAIEKASKKLFRPRTRSKSPFRGEREGGTRLYDEGMQMKVSLERRRSERHGPGYSSPLLRSVR